MTEFPLSTSITRSACLECHFIADSGAIVRPKIECPHCKHADLDTFYPSTSAGAVLDMMQYFYRGAQARAEARSAEAVGAVAQATGRHFESVVLAAAAAEAHDIYSRAGDDEWKPEVSDAMMDAIQDRLGLPSRDVALTIWPDIHEFGKAFEEHKVVVILACTFIEQLLDDALIVLAETYGGMTLPDAEDEVFDRTQGLHSKRALFKKWTPAHAVLDDAVAESARNVSVPTFPVDWKTIRDERNVFIHENGHAIRQATADLAFNLAPKAVPVFAQWRNRYCIT